MKLNLSTQLRPVMLSILYIISFHMAGQSKKEKDQKAIKSMCGCYEVEFNFAETFNYSSKEDYQASKTKRSSGLEWVQLVSDEQDKIVMQHLLIVGDPAHQRVIKHWRQDWVFENTSLFTFDHDNQWKYTPLKAADVKGQWTQKVFQIDDSPRYEGSATWIHVDGQSSWENQTTAPLPRREYTKRNDYNLMLRNNKHAITKTGWKHDQDNVKMIRSSDDEDVILAEEKGLNTYVKVDDVKCLAAQKWWKSNAESWVKVRAKWDQIFAQQKDLSLKLKVKDKPLYKHLFDDSFDMSTSNINRVINSYVE